MINCKLVTTIRKSKVTAKTKLKSVSENVIISKSRDVTSGIGSTTLNDGLSMVTSHLVQEFKTLLSH